MATGKNNNTNLYLAIDALLLLLLLPIAGIGFLLKYILIPGEERLTQYGPFTELEFLGLQRHEWGEIHLVISLVFLAILLLHIILHWAVINSAFFRLLPRKPVRIMMTVLVVAVIILSLVGPFFVTPEEVPSSPHYRNRYPALWQSTNIISIPTDNSSSAGKQITDF
jgi:hypothetical protein